MQTKQPWLGSPAVDITFILSPPFLCLLAVVLLPGVFQNNADMPDAWWIGLILLVDVAHVYSTLYRTYFNRNLYQRYRVPLICIPLLAFALGAMIYSMSGQWFWRLLAYLAVYHFIRQQYGFMRLYSRHERVPFWYQSVDRFTIYYATIYPMLYWHLGGKRNFNWFVEGEFAHFSSDILLNAATGIYMVMLLIYMGKELHYFVRYQSMNIPRVAVLTGTLISWYFGIVYFNGDLSYTLLNVVSHGIPYMALIWIFGKKEAGVSHTGRWLPLFFGKYGLVFFLGLIFTLAYMEEGLWDWAVWNERQRIFGIFHRIPAAFGDTLLTFIVPLLALPQITHYVIDGFIWKKGKTS